MADTPLKDRHAVVTGAGGDIGAAIVAELARLGARVTLMARTAATLEARRAALPTARTAAVTLDVADPASVRTAFARARAELGPPTILVNAAGIGEAAPFAKTDVALWRRTLDVDLTGAFLCAAEVVPGALAEKWGRIVNVASTAGLRGYKYMTAYCAAKHGLIGLTRALALEVATTGVTVNAVCPTYADTEMTQRTIKNIVATTGRSPEQARGALERMNPLGRLITPAEVAQAVGWLCLPTSAAITGQSIGVAGGEVM
ncbi:MAG: SDR family oxidoreductase [Chloroflexota bacterium]|nr:SDR family oxidoreductase [Chloroflexota bacterium]MDE3193365.1 SDR family oxidoreductase [Chloroflexota bacterium]